MPFGTAYAVWTGIGAAGAMIVGIVAFDEFDGRIARDLPSVDYCRSAGASARFEPLKSEPAKPARSHERG